MIFDVLLSLLWGATNHVHKRWWTSLTVKMTTKDLEYDMNLVDKAVDGFERTDSNFERSSTVNKMPSNSTPCYRETIRERKSQLMWQASLLSYFKKLRSHPNLQQPPPPSVTSNNIKARPSTSKKIITH